MRPKEGLPDPRGSLSASLLSSTVAEASRQVQKVLKVDNRKCGPFKSYSCAMHSEIERYACHHGVAAATRVFQGGWMNGSAKPLYALFEMPIRKNCVKEGERTVEKSRFF